jgi:hypothetical protein
MVAGNHRIATQQLAGIALQAAFDTVGQKTLPKSKPPHPSATATQSKRNSPARASRHKARQAIVHKLIN